MNRDKLKKVSRIETGEDLVAFALISLAFLAPVEELK
jgi:hypothetical protein